MSDSQIQNVLQQMRIVARSSGIDSLGPLYEDPEQTSEATSRADFLTMLRDSLRSVNALQETSAELQTRFESGDPNVDLSQVMVAMAKSGLAFDATNQVRNRLLTAYQDIMRMSV